LKDLWRKAAGNVQLEAGQWYPNAQVKYGYLYDPSAWIYDSK